MIHSAPFRPLSDRPWCDGLRLSFAFLILLSILAQGLVCSSFASPNPSPSASSAPDPESAPAQPSPNLSLMDCWELAFRRNRELQIERLNTHIAQHNIDAALAAYDPILLTESRWESLSDSGGYDPADFSRDAIYTADSEITRASLTGLLPGGLNYTFSGQYSHSDGVRNAVDFDAYTIQLAGTVRQPLLRNFWIDADRLAIRSQRFLATGADLTLQYRVLEIAYRVAHAFHELSYAQALVQVQSELVNHRRELLRTVQRRVDAGTLTVLDQHLADSRLASTLASASEAQANLDLAQHELLSLIGDPWSLSTLPSILPAHPLEIPAFTLDLSESWQLAESHRPDLAFLRSERHRAQLDVRFWRNQLFPSLDLVAGYGRRGASTSQVLPPFQGPPSFSEAWDEIRRGDTPNQAIGFVFSLPLSRRAERSQFRASLDLQAQADLRISQWVESIRREIADAHALTRTARDRITSTRDARAHALNALQAEERKLDGGKSTLFIVLELQSQLTDARIAEARARTDLLQSLHRLRFADGSLLHQHGLIWQPTLAPNAHAPTSSSPNSPSSHAPPPPSPRQIPRRRPLPPPRLVSPLRTRRRHHS